MGLSAVLAIALVAAGSSASVSPQPADASCPTHRLGEGALASINRHPGSAESTVPDHPVRMLLCRYWGLNRGRRSLTLAGSRYVKTRPPVESIATEINRLAPFPKRPVACPADLGARIDARFAYEHGPPVFVEIQLSGCRIVRNGRANGGWLSGQLGHRLISLVPVPKGA